jgi:ribonucleotide monophosphatase NagD (HAD superfamily)
MLGNAYVQVVEFFQAYEVLAALASALASVLIVGEKRTADACRDAGTTAANTVSDAVAAVVSVFSDVVAAITEPEEE